MFKEYFKEFSLCYEDYIEQWPFINIFANKLQIGRFNLQRYESGQHFQLPHTERASIDTLQRVFAWMTYLIDDHIKPRCWPRSPLPCCE
jgi:prolyl 4-hydroxylase